MKNSSISFTCRRIFARKLVSATLNSPAAGLVTVKCARLLLLIALLLVAASGFPLPAANIYLTNPLAIERRDELIVFSRAMLQKKSGKISPGSFVVLKNRSGHPLVVQYDDIDGDGEWDELAFLYSFAPKEKLQLVISVSDHPAIVEAIVRAHVRLRKKNPDDTFGPSITHETMPPQNAATDFSKQPLPMYLTEGPAWENDKVAFRQYLDVRNGRDIYGKRVSRMVMDSVGTKTTPSYHDLHEWGMDILRVGKSLGAGAVALQLKSNGHDTLIRLGGPGITKTEYTQVCDGPVRAMFRMKYTWTINGKQLHLTDETSIWGGQFFYETKIIMNTVPDDARLVEGIANFYENVPGHFEKNGEAVLYSYGRQSENKDELGMAIMVNSGGLEGFGSTPGQASEVLNTYTVTQQIQDAPMVYRFYTGWIKTDSRFADTRSFVNFLEEETLKKSKPVLIE